MKAMQYTGYGSPDRLALNELPVPQPSATQLLIKVAATSVNPIDWKRHDGSLRWIVPVKFPSVPGFDVAGEVVAVGDRVDRFKPGDRVLAFLSLRGPGAAAEYCVADEAFAAPVPPGVSDLEAAGMPLAGLTALRALRNLGRLQPDQRVLIVGASGGVGHYAVQIAKSFGAWVAAVCGTANVDWVRDLGADEVIDYTRQPHLEAAQSFDLIFDCVSVLSYRDVQRLLKPAGIYVTTLPRPEFLLRSLFLPLYSARRFKMVMVKPDRKDLASLAEFAAAGRLKTRIDSVYPLEQLAEAHRRSQTGRAAGKILIEVSRG
jgi:NADPH:quinone reductase-like Zn-dependent oxidoreductase